MSVAFRRAVYSPGHMARTAGKTRAPKGLSLDQRENELEHQLRWWAERIAELETQLTGVTPDDIETVRELALFRGRISGAQAMQRHYTQERAALADRHDVADAACAAELAAP